MATLFRFAVYASSLVAFASVGCNDTGGEDAAVDASEDTGTDADGDADGDVDGDTDGDADGDADVDADSETTQPDGWQARSLYYLKRARACVSVPDEDGNSTAQENATSEDPPWDQFRSCTFDFNCTDPSYPECRHLALATNRPDLTSYFPRLEHPAVPRPGGSSGYYLRYVPLCDDGSGDHEYSLFGADVGEAPTCSENEFIRCADGTRPIVYIKPGDSGPIENWLIYAGAGGHAMHNDTNAWLAVHTSAGSYGTGRNPLNQSQPQEGVFSDSSGGTAFNDWNRLIVEKCTPDRYLGGATIEQTSAAIDCSDVVEGCEGILEAPLSDPDTAFDVYLHGRRLLDAVLIDLRDGVRIYGDYATEPPAVEATLNPMSSAERVLLTCHSNGCNGLHMSLDHRADVVHSFAPDADVRAVFNNFFCVSLEGEHAVDESTPRGVVVPGRSIYDHVVTGFSIAEDDDDGHLEISGVTYDVGGHQRLTLEMYGAEMDESCLAFHGDDDAACYNSHHVVSNHLQAPFFYAFAQRDRSLAEGGPFKSPHCEIVPGEGRPCLFDGVEEQFQNLVRRQAADIYNLGRTDRCEAGLEGPAPYDAVALWAPNSTDHSGWHNDAVARVSLGPDSDHVVSLRAAVHAWATTPDFSGICIENVPALHPSASNTALGIPDCVSGVSGD